MAFPGHLGFWWMLVFLYLLQNSKLGETRSLMMDSKNSFIGACSTTCGIGVREIYSTHGCPDNKPTCITGYEQCRDNPDCGFGKVLPQSKDVVWMVCSTIIPEKHFNFVWKAWAKDQEPELLTAKTSILKVYRGLHELTYECETHEKNQIIATIKYRVIPNPKVPAKTDFFSRWIYGVIVIILLLTIGTFAAIFMLFQVIKMSLENKADIESKGDLKNEAVPVSTGIVEAKSARSLPAGSHHLEERSPEAALYE